ncbi:hypothetical protein D3C83_04990 [compost metagenome]
MPPAHVESLAHETLGVVELRLSDAKQAHRHQAVGDLGVIRPEERSPPVQRVLKQRLRLGEVAQPLIDAAERPVHRNLHDRFGVEVLRFDHAAIDQRDDAQIPGRAGGLLAACEQVQHQLLDALRAGRLGQRLIPRGGQAEREERHQTDNHNQDSRRRRQCAPVPSHVLPRPVADRIGTRVERLPFLVVIEVADERLDRLIAARRILVHRRQTEDVDIAACSPAD